MVTNGIDKLYHKNYNSNIIIKNFQGKGIGHNCRSFFLSGRSSIGRPIFAQTDTIIQSTMVELMRDTGLSIHYERKTGSDALRVDICITLYYNTSRKGGRTWLTQEQYPSDQMISQTKK